MAMHAMPRQQNPSTWTCYSGYRSCCGYSVKSAYLLRPLIWPGAGRRIGSGYCRIRTSHKALELKRGAQDGLSTPYNRQPCACVARACVRACV